MFRGVIGAVLVCIALLVGPSAHATSPPHLIAQRLMRLTLSSGWMDSTTDSPVGIQADLTMAWNVSRQWRLGFRAGGIAPLELGVGGWPHVMFYAIWMEGFGYSAAYSDLSLQFGAGGALFNPDDQGLDPGPAWSARFSVPLATYDSEDFRADEPSELLTAFGLSLTYDGIYAPDTDTVGTAVLLGLWIQWDRVFESY